MPFVVPWNRFGAPVPVEMNRGSVQPDEGAAACYVMRTPGMWLCVAGTWGFPQKNVPRTIYPVFVLGYDRTAAKAGVPIFRARTTLQMVGGDGVEPPAFWV